MRGRVDCRIEGAVGIFGQFEGRLHAVLHRGRIGLRDRNVDPHLMNVGDREQGAAIVRVRLDQRADIDIARGDDSVEWRDDVGERLQRLQPIDVRLGGLYFGCLRMRVAVFFVSGLLRHGGRRAERVPAIGRHLGQGHIRLGFREFALRHGQALVELGRVDDSQHIAPVDLSADVLAPLADVAAHLAMNGSACQKLRHCRAKRSHGLCLPPASRPARPTGPPARRSISRFDHRHAAVRRFQWPRSRRPPR